MREYNKRPDDELAVITKSKKLCLYVLSVTDKSPKKFRFTLISRLQGYSLDIVEYLYRANDIVIGKNNTQSEQNERLAYQKSVKISSWNTQISADLVFTDISFLQQLNDSQM